MMITTFQLEADKLDSSILDSIKKAFKGKNIEIIISDTSVSETAEHLHKRMASLRKNKNTVSFSQEKFFKTYRKKIADASN